MPNFPNINTLITKVNLTGDEVIQISATEKSTLKQIAEQLAVNGILSNYTGKELNIVENVISSSDTIIEALEKLEARSGKYNKVLLPLDSSNSNYPSRKGILLVGRDTSNQVSILAIYQINDTSDWVVKKKSLSSLTSSQGTIEGLWTLVYDSPDSSYTLTANDNLREDDNVVTVNPGDVIELTNTPRALRLGSGWVENRSQYQAIIFGYSNIIKDLFSGVTGHQNTLYFSQDFNSDPGTYVQAICIQKVSQSETGALKFLINKCGYDE